MHCGIAFSIKNTGDGTFDFCRWRNYVGLSSFSLGLPCKRLFLAKVGQCSHTNVILQRRCHLGWFCPVDCVMLLSCSHQNVSLMSHACLLKSSLTSSRETHTCRLKVSQLLGVKRCLDGDKGFCLWFFNLSDLDLPVLAAVNRALQRSNQLS